jgi:3-methyladenine DNA glycosylase AlkD
MSASAAESARPTVDEIVSALKGLPSHDAASLRALRRPLSRTLAVERGDQVVELAVQLLATRAPGVHVIAYEIVRDHRAALASIRERDLGRLGERMASWFETDSFACYVAGRVWRIGQVSDDTIAGWARSKSRWWRRAALVSTVALNAKSHGGTGDVERALAVCELLLDDRDDMVVKAMSWALRELAVRDPRATSAYLERRADRLAARVLREVRSKLTIGLKAPRRGAARVGPRDQPGTRPGSGAEGSGPSRSSPR